MSWFFFLIKWQLASAFIFGVKFFFLRKINWYIFWFSVGGQFAGRREMGCGCPLPRRFSGSCMTWLSFVSFFFFFGRKCICCIVWLDILLLCGDISSLDQYKQRKHGVWEGTRGPWTQKFRVKLQKSGGRRLDFHSLWWTNRGESAMPRNLGKENIQLGYVMLEIYHWDQNLSLGSHLLFWLQCAWH